MCEPGDRCSDCPYFREVETDYDIEIRCAKYDAESYNSKDEKMRYKNLKEIPCPCCGENSLGWAEDRSYMPDVPFVLITCDTCDFEFGAEWNKTSRESLLSDFECYLKDLNNNK